MCPRHLALKMGGPANRARVAASHCIALEIGPLCSPQPQYNTVWAGQQASQLRPGMTAERSARALYVATLLLRLSFTRRAKPEGGLFGAGRRDLRSGSHFLVTLRAAGLARQFQVGLAAGRIRQLVPADGMDRQRTGFPGASTESQRCPTETPSNPAWRTLAH